MKEESVRKQLLSTWLPVPLIQKFKSIVAAQGSTMAAELRWMIAEYIQKHSED